jgi:iron(III) transport system substrate-binding protein
MPANNRNGVAIVIAAAAVVSAVALFVFSSGETGPRPLVVYCAHDSVFSESILDQFEAETGIDVDVRFDTEATKALSLVNLLIQEKNHPRCDVFWNNEVLGTLDLHDQNILVPYKGSGYERVPAQYKDPNGNWTGFAARLRVYIVNSEKIRDPVNALRERLSGDLSRMAIAKPLYGTTRTHFTVLWKQMGSDKLKSWHADARSRRMREVNGNAEVMRLVAAGTCDFGWTDTDDFFAAKDEGKPVEMVPIGVDDLPVSRPGPQQVMLIPNSVGIVRGTQKLAEAQRLVDFLLSAKTELALAKSASRQIPLGPVDARELPEEVRKLAEFTPHGYDLNSLGSARQECLEWLKSEYLR